MSDIKKIEVGGVEYDIVDASAVKKVNMTTPDENGNVNISVPVDSALSESSENPVQNKAVKVALDGKADSGHSHSYNDLLDKPTVLDGTDGVDGVSPTVSVSTITGGHQVSITDANGTNAFNVMDGEDGSSGKSAYQSYLDTGGTLSEAQWIASLKQTELPEIVDSIEDMTDTSKVYVLKSDGMIYGYQTTTVTTDETPAYTDLVPTSVNQDGTPYNDGLGYKSGYRINSSGVEGARDGMYVTGYIPVAANDVIRIKNHGTQTGSNNSYIGLYTESFSLYSLFYSNTNNSSPAYDTRPDGNGIVTVSLTGVYTSVRYIRVTSYPDSEPRMIITKNEEIVMVPGSTETVTTWSSTGLAYSPADYEDRIVSLEHDVAELKQGAGTGTGTQDDNIEFYLPDILYCSVGRELSLYYSNFTNLRNPANYEFRVRAYTKNHFSVTNDRIRIIPTAAFNLSTYIDVYKNDALIASCPITVIAVAETSIPSINAIFIGDSLTEANYSQSELKNLMGDALTLSGTVVHSRSDSGSVSREVKAEGRSGWSTSSYQTNATTNNFTNPFYNPTANAFDFSYYMTNSGSSFGTITDVFIMLGTNDSLKMLGTETPTANVSQMIESIQSYSSSIRVHIMLPPIFTTDDNTYLQNQYGYGFSMRLESAAMQKLWMDYKTLTNNIVPAGLCLDMVNDMPQAQVPMSQRNSSTITIVSDSVHPAKVGYYKIADVLFSYILNKCV